MGAATVEICGPIRIHPTPERRKGEVVHSSREQAAKAQLEAATKDRGVASQSSAAVGRYVCYLCWVAKP